MTLVVGSTIVAAVSGREPATAPPSPSPTASPSPTLPPCTPVWEIVASADPSETSNVLNDVVAISSAEAWAVGASGFDPVSPTAVLIESWDGEAWTAIEVPSPGSQWNELLAVDASEPNDVWAVGRTASGFGDRPLVLRFDGTAWTQVELPDDVTGVLTGVAAVTPTDVWAVGYTGEPVAMLERALVLHWDGAFWAIFDPGRSVGGGKSLLRDVDAVSSTDVWATGYHHNQPLIIRFDGEAWSRSETQVRGSAYAIEVVAPTEAWTVGSPIQRFDGDAWTEVAALPSDGELHAVAAVAPGDVWAAGSRPSADGVSTRALVMRWAGQRWRQVEGPGIPGADVLTGIDALPDGTVLGVGYRDVAAGRRALAIRGTSCPPAA